MIARPPQTSSAVPAQPDVVVEVDIVTGTAVALVPVEDGFEFRLCSSRQDSGYPDYFYGFAASGAAEGAHVVVYADRGRRIQPLIEDDGVLVVGEPVFLSTTPGRVSSVAPTGDEGFATVNLMLGIAISETEMVFKTDFSFR